MKRTERRHLKDNELATFALNAQQAIEARRRDIIAILAVVLVAGGAGGGYYLWRSHVQRAAHALLADALAVDDAQVGPPANPDAPDTELRFPTERAKAQAALTKFKIVADGYPSTDAGIFARYREASTWMLLGSPGEAATTYQEVIDRSGDGLYGQMARLGFAEAQAETGQADQAIAAFKALADKKDGSLPVDGILMQLGRTALAAGKTTEAQQAFNRIVQEYPDSSFSVEAKQALDDLKKTG